MIEEIVKAKLEILTSKIKEKEPEILITENILVEDDTRRKQQEFPLKGSLSYGTHLDAQSLLEDIRPSLNTNNYRKQNLEKSSFLLCISIIKI